MKKPKLPKDTKNYYYYLEPIYDHYRDVKVIDRCQECNHKIGEHIEKRGVKVIGYKIVKAKKDWLYAMRKLQEKRMESAMRFWEGNWDLFNGKKKGSVLKIKRYSKLSP